VGRGEQQSFCLLFPSVEDQLENSRLKAMESNYSGFTLAEIDWKIRGPGEIYGTQQSGFQQLKVASWTDEDGLLQAKNAAKKIAGRLTDFPLLQEKLKKLTIQDVKPN
jgi:ATP-dependent DNA helicase RecG